MFALEIGSGAGGSRPPFLAGHKVLLVNARSAILFLLEWLSTARVWMPSYLCGSMLLGAYQRGVGVEFFDVNHDLRVSSLAWLDGVRPGDLVVLIDYFGFPCESACAIEAKRRGAWVLEDACSALLSSHVGRCADFVVFSPRKFLGVPDGGILSNKCGLPAPRMELQSPPPEWWIKALSAGVERREFDRHGGDRRWFELFQEVEAEAPVGHYAMSELSRALLTHSFDYSAIARQRVANYRVLADMLWEIAVFPDLPSGTVPLGFPIRVKDRDHVRQTLFDHEIYPPVHWPIKNVVPSDFVDSHRLAAEIMTLPCDQRYGEDDMARMASTLLRELT